MKNFLISLLFMMIFSVLLVSLNNIVGFELTVIVALTLILSYTATLLVRE